MNGQAEQQLLLLIPFRIHRGAEGAVILRYSND